jgi:hypothetical protein
LGGRQSGSREMVIMKMNKTEGKKYEGNEGRISTDVALL